MKYQTYDEFLALVAELRLEHRDLTDDELDKLVKQTLKIDQTVLDSYTDYLFYAVRHRPGSTIYITFHNRRHTI